MSHYINAIVVTNAGENSPVEVTLAGPLASAPTQADVDAAGTAFNNALLIGGLLGGNNDYVTKPRWQGGGIKTAIKKQNVCYFTVYALEA